jgi:cysteine synthase B
LTNLPWNGPVFSRASEIFEQTQPSTRAAKTKKSSLFEPMIFSDAMDFIGNTPVVDITCLSPNPRARLLVKLEGQNPFGSFKDRVARAMLEEARRDGRLSPGQMVLAPSSGNTGISLAGLGGMIGADVVITSAELGTKGAIGKAYELAEKNPDWCLLDQYSFDSNARAHFETTAPEIWRAAPEITHFVAGIGSGGTLVGVGRFLKERNSSVALIAVEPEHGHPIEGVRNMVEGNEPGLFLKWGGHGLIDFKLHIRHADSLGMTEKLARKCGIFAGPSSGMAMVAALEIAAGIERGTILFLACDGGWKYLTSLGTRPANPQACPQTD